MPPAPDYVVGLGDEIVVKMWGRVEGIRVSLIGEVRLPGGYNVSSLHTALQVLAMAGG